MDGFAGAGEYTGGEPGSPIIAIDAALTHRANLSDCKMDFLFVEERLDRFQNLDALLQERTWPDNVTVKRLHGEFRKVFAEELLKATHQQRSFSPSFVMIDPFGFEGVPLNLIEQLSRFPSSETLISFMYDSVTRWLGDSRNTANFDELFGCTDWRSALDIDSPDERKGFLLNLYVDQLKSHGWRYVRTFEMKDDGNRTEYFLVFCTNHLEGVKVMKEAMWKVDPSGAYLFSDATDPNQLTLFRAEPDYSLLKRLLIDEFRGRDVVKIEELEEYVLIETAFRETHYKTPILTPMERGKELRVISSPRKTTRGYPDGTLLTFKV